jgi:hypothetical protein
MSCICFFTRHCATYADLFTNIHYLTKARKHLEQYMEISSVKQTNQMNQQQQQFAWKLKNETNSLCKQMTTKDVDE